MDKPAYLRGRGRGRGRGVRQTQDENVRPGATSTNPLGSTKRQHGSKDSNGNVWSLGDHANVKSKGRCFA